MIQVMGEVGILNVGAGDTRLVFDPSKPEDSARAARIVRDMIRRGFAILVEVDDGKGGKTFARATDFREETHEYIISDDPAEATEADAAPATRRRRRTAIPASDTRSVAVARSAGG
jgi:hypothetical protein